MKFKLRLFINGAKNDPLNPDTSHPCRWFTIHLLYCLYIHILCLFTVFSF